MVDDRNICCNCRKNLRVDVYRVERLATILSSIEIQKIRFRTLFHDAGCSSCCPCEWF